MSTDYAVDFYLGFSGGERITANTYDDGLQLIEVLLWQCKRDITCILYYTVGLQDKAVLKVTRLGQYVSRTELPEVDGDDSSCLLDSPVTASALDCEANRKISDEEEAGKMLRHTQDVIALVADALSVGNWS